MLDRCGISQFTTPTLDTATAARAYAASGLGSIGVWLRKLEQPDRLTGFFIPDGEIPEPVIAEAIVGIDAARLKVSHVVFAGFFVTDDEELRQRRVAYTAYAVDVAQRFGADCLIIAPGRLEGRTVEQAHDLAARSLAEVFDARPDSRVRLALEPVINVQSDYMNSIDRALDLIELVGHERLGVYPDNFHLWINSRWESGPVFEQIERAGGRIFGVHVNDAVRGSEARYIPGDGELPVAEFVAAVEATGYRGQYDIEFMYAPELIAAQPDEYGPHAVIERCRAGFEKTLAGVLDPETKETDRVG
jgi:sugar phosphate isomerase/epimerase